MSGVDQLKPKMKRRGMFHMKHVTVELMGKYERRTEITTRHSLIGYLYEVCNLSNGRRTLDEIRRILGHELVWMDIDLLGEMVTDMERLDYLTLET